MKKNDVFGIGNILVDILVKTDDKFINELGLKKGQFHEIDEIRLREIASKVDKSKIKVVPGGSVVNTLVGIANLGGNVAFYGKIGNDKHGLFLEGDLKKNKIKNNLKRSSKMTGKALTFITPDNERTFAVHLGAAIDLKKKEILEEEIKNSKYLHLTGYEIEASKDSCLHAIDIARKNKIKISIDLADPGVIERNPYLRDVIKNANILFLNEQEAKALTHLEPEKAIEHISSDIDIVAIKLGAKGSIIRHNNRIIKIDGVKAKAVDTTGAGDMYSACILYGISNGWSIEKSANLASFAAAKVVEQIGARVDYSLREKIRI